MTALNKQWDSSEENYVIIKIQVRAGKDVHDELIHEITRIENFIHNTTAILLKYKEWGRGGEEERKAIKKHGKVKRIFLQSGVMSAFTFVQHVFCSFLQ